MIPLTTAPSSLLTVRDVLGDVDVVAAVVVDVVGNFTRRLPDSEGTKLPEITPSTCTRARVTPHLSQTAEPIQKEQTREWLLDRP